MNVLTIGWQQQQLRILLGNTYLVGRDQTCQIRVPVNQSQVSRKQAEIKSSGSHFFIKNIGRAEVRLNGHAIPAGQKAKLYQQSIVQIGPTFEIKVLSIRESNLDIVQCFNCHRTVERKDFCEWCGYSLAGATTNLG